MQDKLPVHNPEPDPEPDPDIGSLPRRRGSKRLMDALNSGAETAHGEGEGAEQTKRLSSSAIKKGREQPNPFRAVVEVVLCCDVTSLICTGA